MECIAEYQWAWTGTWFHLPWPLPTWEMQATTTIAISVWLLERKLFHERTLCFVEAIMFSLVMTLRLDPSLAGPFLAFPIPCFHRGSLMSLVWVRWWGRIGESSNIIAVCSKTPAPDSPSPILSKSCVKIMWKDVPYPRHVLEAANTPSSTPQLPHPDPDLSTCTQDYSC
jgi:hypothetical protein